MPFSDRVSLGRRSEYNCFIAELLSYEKNEPNMKNNIFSNNNDELRNNVISQCLRSIKKKV
ncbi:hypothetical protein BLOT_005439 [Blomia tropicalis]|nr:hypothetical protein BLOT_005439 [Blomia tropicalis]